MRLRNATFFLLAGGALLTTSCGLNGAGFDCTEQSSALEQTEAAQGILNEGLPTYDDMPEEERAYPMALVLNTDAINTMLAAVLDQELPAIKQDLGGLLEIEVQPALPLIQIGQANDILASLDMEVSVGNDLLGHTNGMAAATMSLPVELAPQGDKSTSFMARMDQAEFLDIELGIGGLSTGDSRLVSNFLADLATDILQSEYGATEVTSINSWELGDGDMLLAPQGLRISGASNTILFGLGSNVAVSSDGMFHAEELAAQSTIPDDAQVGLHLHPSLLLGVTQRLMSEGHIERSYDEDGASDEDGLHQVTLMNMGLAQGGDNESSPSALNTEFRIWRTGGGLCGFADVSSNLSAQVTGSEVVVDISDLRVTDGEGVGQFFSEASWLAGDFLDALTDQLSLTLNYKDFSVDGEGGMVVPEANALTLNGTGVSVYLDLTTIIQ
jgi:hypothetical protein